MNWFTKILPGVKKKPQQQGEDDVWEKCRNCETSAHAEQLRKNGWVCANCDYHHRLTAVRRADILFDEAPQEIAAEVRPMDFLNFNDSEPYRERLKRAQRGDARRESAAAYCGRVKGREIAAVIFDFTFMGGSMGSVAGERFVRAAELAAEKGLPFVSFTASGGARMQEGMVSLFQMAKTTAALSLLSRRRLPHINVLTDPTTGGGGGEFRAHRRHRHRRAAGVGGIRRTARHQRDGARRVARRISAQRVFARARRDRHDCRPARNARGAVAPTVAFVARARR